MLQEIIQMSDHNSNKLNDGDSSKEQGPSQKHPREIHRLAVVVEGRDQHVRNSVQIGGKHQP